MKAVTAGTAGTARGPDRLGRSRAGGVPWLVWSVVLAVVALAPQLAVASGVFAPGDGATAGPVTATVLVAVVWLAIAVGLRVEQPVITLAVAGALHGAASLALDLGPRSFPVVEAGMAQPTGTVAIVAANVAFGALLGLAALVVGRNRAPAVAR